VFNDSESIIVGLTLEDDFTLTRLKNNANYLKGEDRDQYLWKTIFKFVCRERAFKSVMDELGLAVDTNVDIFDDPEGEDDV
jgi:hypothetical protein